MPKITRLVQGKKNPNRVNLYLDGEFAFALSIDAVGSRSLKPGLELSESEILNLKEEDLDGKVYGLLLNFLSYRPRTVKEVRDRLYKYEVRDIDKQNALIAKLQSQGYLDDLKFAEWFVESRNSHRPRSRRMLSQELQLKGISREIIDQLGADMTDESKSLSQLIHKKFGEGGKKLDPNVKQKVYGYLSRQGFAWDKITEVVKTWESE